MNLLAPPRAVVASGLHVGQDASGLWLSQRYGGRRVELYFDHPMVSGGHLRGKVSPNSASVAMPDGTKLTFLKVGTTERWLISMTTGTANYRGGLYGPRSLFDLLHGLVEKGADGQGRLIKGRMPRPSTGPCDDDAPDEPDPMDEIQCIDLGRGGGGRAMKRPRVQDPGGVRPHRNPHKGDVVEFEVPKRCPEEDPDCTEKERIRLYIQDKRSIWLHADNLQWAVSYLQCQHWLKGVPLVAGCDPGPGAGPDPAPPTPLDSDLDLGSSPGVDRQERKRRRGASDRGGGGNNYNADSQSLGMRTPDRGGGGNNNDNADSQSLGMHTPDRGGGGNNSDGDSDSQCLGVHTFDRSGGGNVIHAD